MLNSSDVMHYSLMKKLNKLIKRKCVLEYQTNTNNFMNDIPDLLMLSILLLAILYPK